MAGDGVRCIECGSREAELVGGKRVYPHRPDLYAKRFWRCPCGAFVGCHPGTDNALGSCAGPETRKARRAAHAAFDPIWKSGQMKRGDAYRALAERMGIAPERCHISWMGADEARRAAKVAAEIRTLQRVVA